MGTMMKKLITFLAIWLMLVAPAIAKPWTVGQQSISYPATGVNGTIMAPNTAPAYAYQLADIPSNFTEANWIHSGGTAVGQFDAPPTAGESKGRFDCQETIVAKDDPLIAFNTVNGSSHFHHFMGNYLGVTQGYAYNLDYNTLRASGNSTCYGGPINRSNYWEPLLYKVLTNGVTAGKRALTFVTYYKGSPDTTKRTDGSLYDVDKVSIWPRGWSVIGGFDMADPGNSRRASLISTAGTGYTYAEADAKFTPGYLGIYCETPVSGNGSVATSPVAGSAYQPWLRNGDGTPTLNCAASGTIVFDFETQACWDGYNLDSPNERLHVAYPIRDNGLSGSHALKCPQNWAVIPTLEAKAEFTQAGQSDYTSWWFSSDRMAGMDAASFNASFNGTTMSVPGAVTGAISAYHAVVGAGIPANTMVVSGSGTTWTLNTNVGVIASEAVTSPFNNGETGHFDFTPAWSYGTAAAPGVFLRMMQHCPGLTITQASTGGSAATLAGDPHLCGTGRFTSTEQLFVDEASPDASAPNPILTLAPNRVGKNGYFPAAPHTAIPGTVHHTH